MDFDAYNLDSNIYDEMFLPDGDPGSIVGFSTKH